MATGELGLSRLLARYAGPYWRGWTWIAFLTVLNAGTALLQPWPLMVLVDHVLGGAPMPAALAAVAARLPGGSEGAASLIGWIAAASLLIFAAGSAAEALLTMEWTRVGRRMVYDLGRDLFARTARRSPAFHARHPVGDSMSRVTGDAWCLYGAADALLFAPGHALLTAAAVVVVMARLDAGLTILALAVAPFMSAAAWTFGRSIRGAARARRDIEGRIQAHVHQTLTGVGVVQAFTREEHEQRLFQRNASLAIRAHQRTALVESLYGLASGLAASLGTAAVLWSAASRVLDGRLTVGTTLVFIAYLATLQRQLQVFPDLYTALQEAGASLDRVREFMAPDRSDVVERPRGAARPAARGDVAIERVEFAYEQGRPVLQDVTLTARAGDTIAIVGPTGAGKSTLVSLIPRFVDPTKGRVLLDGRDVRDLTLDSLRAQVAVVLQEPFLFPMSVADNIGIGRPGATRADIESAARAANASGFVERLPDGYDTVLGPRGGTLSGGERQRLAIARAILKDAPILVLDEPTSSVDAETEHALLQAFERLMRGRTTFVIAHRLSTIRTATRIFVLEHGRIVEQGTHAELVARGGAYRRLHRLQAGEPAGSPAA